MISDYCVRNEFDRLKICATGIPVNHFLRNGTWSTYEYPALKEECIDLERVLVEHGVEILPQHIITEEEYRDKFHPETNMGCSQLFPRDNLVMIGCKCFVLGDPNGVGGFVLDGPCE